MSSPGVEALAPFVGDWQVHLDMPGVALADVRATTSFRPVLDGRYLEQRATVDRPEFPDVLAVIAPSADGAGYTQHYFDSRGVVRLYAMTFGDGAWTLAREREDFSPLSFAQRWTARFGDDGATIRGKWEKQHPGGPWELDFHLVYTRA